jgi:Concanavalin A-like lectin/glucanases superfamily
MLSSTNGSRLGWPLTRGARLLITVFSAVAIVVLATRPAEASTVVALWHMDETSGSIMHDSSGHGNNGTIRNVRLGVRGFLGQAYLFDGEHHGNSSAVTVPSSASLNPNSANLRIAAHVRIPGRPYGDVIRKGRTGTAGGDYKMEIAGRNQSQPGRLLCEFHGSSGHGTIVTGPRIDDGKWHAVSCVKTKTWIGLTVDGALFSKNVTIGSIRNTAPLQIGYRSLKGPLSHDTYNGYLDEASVSIG